MKPDLPARAPWKVLTSRRALWVYLVLVLVLGSFLRFYGNDWDNYLTVHPDERLVVSFIVPNLHWPTTPYKPPLSEWLSTLNPHFFGKNSLPFYILAVSSHVAQSWFLKAGESFELYALARCIMAFCGVLTLWVTFLLARRAGGPAAGVLAALFLCLTVLHIQHSHFYVVEVMQTLFLTAALLFGFQVVRQGRGFIWLGVFFGLALATKVSSAAFLAPMGVAVLLRQWQERKYFAPRLWGSAALALLVALGVCFLGSPFSFWDFEAFREHMRFESGMVRLDPSLFFTLQYIGTTRYLYPLYNLFWHSAGPPLTILMLGGVIFSLVLAVRKRSLTDIYLLGWVIPFFLVTGGFGTKFARYLIPLFPALAVTAALLVVRCRGKWRRALQVFTAVAVLYSLAYSIAYVCIYSRPHTYVQASEWIYEHVPEGARYLVETDAAFNVPVALEGKGSPEWYEQRHLDLYREPDDERKAGDIAQKLEWADYLFSSSSMLYSAVFRSPDRFRVTCNFYRNLFAGNLGFELVRTVTSPPNLFGYRVNEDLADEVMTFFDHPKVHVFKKTAQLDKKGIADRILAPSPAIQNIPRKEILTMHAGKSLPLEKYQDTQRPTSLPAGWVCRGMSSPAAALLWFAMIQCFGAASLPLTFFLLRRLPDRGYACSKAVGVLLFAYLNWMLVSLHILPNTAASLLLALALALCLNGYALVRLRGELVAFVRENRVLVLATEAVFAALFAAFLVFRMFHPDIFDSESTPDISLVTSSMRSLDFPPWEVWVAGFRVNYYYYGQYITGALTRLCGIPVELTYNLMFATVPALAGGLLFSLLYNLTRRFRYGLWAVAIGLFSCNLDAFLYGLARFVQRALQALELPSAESTAFLQRLTDYALTPLGFLFQKLLSWGWLNPESFSPPGLETSFRYFRSAHEVIPWTVHEFPFWTFTYVDLHAHLLAMPMYLLSLCLILNLLFQTGRQGLGLFGSGPARWARLALYGLLFASIFPTSSWSYPVLVLMLAAVLLLRAWDSGRSAGRAAGTPGAPVRSPAERALRAVGAPAWHTVVPLSLIVVAGLFLFLPYLGHFHHPVVGLGWVHQHTTGLKEYLTVNGFFVFMVTVFCLGLVAAAVSRGAGAGTAGFRVLPPCGEPFPGRGEPSGPHARNPPSGTSENLQAEASNTLRQGLRLTSRNQAVALLAGAVLLVAASQLLAHGVGRAFHPVRDYQTAGLLFPFAVALFALLPGRRRDPGLCFALLAAAFFVLTGFGLEIACVKDDYYGAEMTRFNSIFKYYSDAWYLGAVFSAYTLFLMAGRLSGTTRSRRAAYGLWMTVFLLFFAATLVFVPLGLQSRMGYHRQCPVGKVTPTLNGWACLASLQPDVYAGIQWVRRNVPYSPVLLEAAGNNGRDAAIDYLHQYSFVSAFTGLPTVMGWEFHMHVRHYREPVGPTLQPVSESDRGRDVQTIYNTLDLRELTVLLSRYQVRYIWIGPLEREVYDAEGLRKFEVLADPFPVVFRQGDVCIHRVRGLDLEGIDPGAAEEFRRGFEERLARRQREEEQRAAREEEEQRREIQRQAGLPPVFMTEGGLGIRKGMFNWPHGMAADRDGNVYVADFLNERLQRFDSGGRFQLMWGSRGEGPGQFWDPCDVAVDSRGHVYVLDTFNSRIQKFSSTGRFLKMWGEVGFARSLSVGPDDLIYVSVTNGDFLRVFDGEGRLLRTIGGQGSREGEFRNPIGILAHGNGRLYVADAGNRRLQILTREGGFLAAADVPGWQGEFFVEPYLAQAPNGDILATDPTAHCVYRFDPEGKLLTTVWSEGRFDLPMGVVCTPDGKIYVSSCRDHRIHRLAEME